ncbi:MAG: 5-formyltetrahydrofolate cyclo-ligase [Xanthomonadaceae bacterium]|nr:5-formyltetrahydrofolate cyclo-ligase [Xanthomonadaceae bacterium]MDE1960879.1 5-formyltetrahydrofolate cyclo-ligase [Xanthomonadaceae bacterium]MDE2085505.1 5-formyltetrahydrofolate cyclo-ligase [Xanthomonadaceae bacterium]MDE2257797.1 5-formyltetrahydrofolate cyclo-ligase [Xanthomonadaceae bacterium]
MNRDPGRIQLRRRQRALCTQLPARERASAAAALVSSLEGLPEFLVDNRIAGYWAVRGEMPLHAVYASLRARGQGYFLPVLGNERTLRFAQWQAGAALRNNRYGIPEPDVPATVQAQPDTLDLMLVPLLGFDRRGNRLGSGGGWYDRSFAFLRDRTRPARPVLVGIGYHFQEIAELAPEPWDVQLDFVATDRELIDCTKSPA